MIGRRGFLFALTCAPFCRPLSVNHRIASIAFWRSRRVGFAVDWAEKFEAGRAASVANMRRISDAILQSQLDLARRLQ